MARVAYPSVISPARIVRRCRSCEGRGWRLASSVRSLLVAEDALALTRRACPDCTPGFQPWGPVAG
jgi:hypothetical protein